MTASDDPNTLTIEHVAAASRILAQARPMCKIYARLYLRWVNSPKSEQESRLSELRNHVRNCGCRVDGHKPGSEWIFEGGEE
jgi:hypothetical protein